MNYMDMYQWLVQEKQLGSRSAKDVVSRCKRISRMLDTDVLNNSTAKSLEQNEQFVSCSIYIKSQLRRALSLAIEFQSLSEACS